MIIAGQVAEEGAADKVEGALMDFIQVRLLPDGDGGLLRFTFVPPGRIDQALAVEESSEQEA